MTVQHEMLRAIFEFRGGDEIRHRLVKFDDVVADTVLVQKLSHVIHGGNSVAGRVRRFHSNKPANERGGLISLVFDDPEQFVAHGILQL